MIDDFLAGTREHMRAILRSSRLNYTSPRFDTSDVLQDSIMQVYREMGAGDRQAKPVCQRWLRMVALGHLAKLIRFNKAGKRSVERERGQSQFPNLDHSTRDPARLSVNNELIEKAIASLAELEPRQRQIVNLRFFQHLTYEEIAGKLDISVHAVRSGLFRSLKHLRNQIEPAHGATSRSG